MMIFTQIARKSKERQTPRRPTTARPASRFRPALESVERREVLSGGTVSLVNGTVWIAPDTTAPVNNAQISTHNNQVDVQLNGQDYLFDASSVFYLIFDASQTGPDTRQVYRNDTALPSFAMGGGGVNQFTAGHGFDTFMGGSGRNEFTARDGFVFFIGGAVGSNEFTEGSGSGIILTFGPNNRVNSSSGTYYVYAF
jgi:hypothetical protein